MTAPGPNATLAASFDYALWAEILRAIVTPEGKVDYEILGRHRARLSAFVTQLGSASPNTAPALFPTPEHARFHEPRIHFALNCASNGCPPLRPQAFVPEDIRQTLGAATRQFLASEWNCRIDRPQQKI